MSDRRATLTAEDLQYSGPHVWPRLEALLTVDRFIFRRPEIAYLAARREVEKFARELRPRESIMPPLPVVFGTIETPTGSETPVVPAMQEVVTKREIRIAIRQVKKEDSRIMRTLIGGFRHRVRSDMIEDVRTFLDELRTFLYRRVSIEPLPTVSISIDFFLPRRIKKLATFQAYWL